MATSAGKRQKNLTLATGDNIVVYSDLSGLFLQLRREVPTQQDILAPSFKTVVSLTEDEALALASELLFIVVGRRGVSPASQDEVSE